MPPDSIHSYHRFMWENLFSHVDIDAARTCTSRAAMSPRERGRRGVRRSTRRRSARAGGIDFQILGIGKTGHIGFNEPGSGADSRTRLVHARRGHATRRRRRLLRRGERAARSDHDGRRDDPRGARDRASSPRASTRPRSSGARSRASRPRGRRDVPAAPPATPRSTSIARPAAELTRIATPWLLDEVEWTPALTVRAVIWLSRADRQRRSSSSRSATTPSTTLVAARALRLAGRGERRGVQRARREDPRALASCRADSAIICFSPHPDDDVISMGGILRKLVAERNDIIVAYMTSGNIAVFDHDVRRYVDFLRAARRERRGRARCGAPLARQSTISSRRSSRATSTSRRCRTSSGSFARRRR